MHDIICPHCSKAFKIDESGYADILRQVRDHAFAEQLQERLSAAEQDKAAAVQLALAQAQAQLSQSTAQKDAQIASLQASLRTSELEKNLAVTTALNQVEKQRDSLQSQLDANKLQQQLAQQALCDKYETQLRDRDEAIERLRDLKARLSTKMVGETLEQHCQIEFDRLRATAFPKAYFEKDNDARSGSKGDYIFRDFDDNKVEIVSIMFEMKNESDTEQCLGKT